MTNAASGITNTTNLQKSQRGFIKHSTTQESYIPMRHIYCAILLFAALMITTLGAAQTITVKPLSHRAFKKLVNNPATPEDHLRIADYYHRDANKLRKESEMHALLAIDYAKGKLFTPKSGIPNGQYEHCKVYGENLAKAADEADALGLAHQRMAEEMRHQCTVQH